MRVLHVFKEINFSGAEIMYANAAPLFQKEGIEMTAIATGKKIGEFKEQFELVDITVMHFPLLENSFSPLYLFKYFQSIYKFIKSEKFDVIHIHRASYYWFFSLVGWLIGIKIVRTVHNVFYNSFVNRFKIILDRFIARFFFKVKFQTIGDSVYKHELKYYRNPSIRINNWYDSHKFYPAISIDEKLKKRHDLNIPEDCFVIISTGACSPVKNHHHIIKAISSLNEDVECLYLHLGKGACEQEEVLLAKELNVFHKIQFLGNKINVRDYLIASDLFVMTSKHEGLSIASIEAMACGLPSVLYDAPGLRDLITNNDNGFLVKQNYDELAKKIKYFAEHEKEATRKGFNASLFVDKNFSIKYGVKQIIDLCYLNS